MSTERHRGCCLSQLLSGCLAVAMFVVVVVVALAVVGGAA